MSELDSDSRRYFMKMKYQERQFLRARDFRDEQNYHIEKAKNHNSTLHTRGICGEGMKVTISKDKTNCVNVSAGTAIDALGNTIFLAKDETVDLSKFSLKTGEIFLTVRYGESNSRDPQYKQDEGGFKGVTRTLEKPDFELWSAANTDSNRLLLAVIERKDGKIVSCDDNPESTGRLVAGVAYNDFVKTGDLHNQSVTTEKIKDGAVTTEKLEKKTGFNLGTIDTANPPGFDMDEEKAGLGGRAADMIKEGLVTAGAIQAGAVTMGDIQAGGRAADRIKDGFAVNANLQGLDMTDEKAGTGAVNAGAIQAGAATGGNQGDSVSSRIRKGAVATANIQDGAVTSAELATNAVTSAKLASDAVTTAKIKDGAVTSAKLEKKAAGNPGAVATANIQDGAVTAIKIKEGTVTSTNLEIVNVAEGTKGAVATANIQVGAVMAGKLASGAVTSSKLAPDAVTADKVKDGSLPFNKLNFDKHLREFSIKRGKDDASSQIELVLCMETIDYISNFPYWINVWATGSERGASTPTVQWYQKVYPLSDPTVVRINVVAQITGIAEGDTAYCKCVLFRFNT